MKTGIQTKINTVSPTNKLVIGTTPNSTKFSTKRGISNDQIRDVPKYLTNNYTPQNNENPLKNLITQSEQGKPPKTTLIASTRNPNQIKTVINNTSEQKVSHSLSPSKNLKKYIIITRSANSKSYLPPQEKETIGKKTLVLDLDETLVHSSFNQFDHADIILKIELENKIHQIYVLKRPGVEEFLERMSKYYEIVIYTASLSKYADPLIDILDPNRFCQFRLFREHCSFINSVYIKDLTKLGRNLKDIIIIDNTPASYALQTDCGIPIKSWYEDKEDRELYLLTPILEFLSGIYDIRDYMKKFIIANEISYKLAWQVINSHRNENVNNHVKAVSYPDNSSHLQNNNIKIEKEKSSSFIEKTNTDNNINVTDSQTKLENKQKVPENKMININIYNHNINHFIISPKENKKQLVDNNKNIKSFRSSYSNNTSLKPNDNWSANLYNIDKKANKPINELNNKLIINSDISSVTTPQNNNQISTSTNKKITSNIKIITNKTSIGNKTPQNHRPASAYFNKTRSLREKSNTSNLKDSSNKNGDFSFIKRKNSATSFLNPISTNSNINRSESASSYSANTAKSQKSSIIYNKNQLDQMKNVKGNNTARINTSVVKPVNSNVTKKPIGIKVSVTKNNIANVKRENSRDSLNSTNSKRSYSLSSRSREKKMVSKNVKNLRLLDDPRFFDNKSNVSDSSYTNSNKNGSNRYTSLKKKNIQIRVNSVNRNINNTPKSIKGTSNINVGLMSYANRKNSKDNISLGNVPNSPINNIIKLDTK